MTSGSFLLAWPAEQLADIVFQFVRLLALLRGEPLKHGGRSRVFQRRARLDEQASSAFGQLRKAVHIKVSPTGGRAVGDQGENGGNADGIVLGLSQTTQERQEGGVGGARLQTERRLAELLPVLGSGRKATSLQELVTRRFDDLRRGLVHGLKVLVEAIEEGFNLARVGLMPPKREVVRGIGAVRQTRIVRATWHYRTPRAFCGRCRAVDWCARRIPASCGPS